MNIKCLNNGQIYDSENKLNQLIDYLKSKNETETIKLIDLDSQGQSNIHDFFHPVTPLEPPLACVVQWFQRSNNKIIPCYSLSRQQFIFQNQARIYAALADTSTSEQAGKKIRPTKLSLSNSQDAPLQYQQQQQQQKEPIQRVPNQTKIELKPRDNEPKVVEIRSNEVGKLITRESLQNNSILSSITECYNLVFPGSIQNKKSLSRAASLLSNSSMTRTSSRFNASANNQDRQQDSAVRTADVNRQHPPSLLDIFDNAVGKGASSIQDKSKTITGIEEAYFLEIITHYDQCLYGINQDNPPVVVDECGEVLKRGEFCKVHNSDQYVLRFAPSLQASLENKSHTASSVDKLTVLLAPPFKRPEVGDFIALTTEPNDGIQQAFNQLNNSQATDEAKSAFNGLIECVSSDDNLKQITSRLLEQLETSLNKEKKPFKPKHYQYLADTLVHGGAEGLLCLLKAIQGFEDKGFMVPFLDNPINFSQWATTDGLARLDALARFNGAEGNWWKALIEQHHSAGAPMNFKVLFDAFEQFRQQLKDNVLPVSFPFKGIRHMQLALARLGYILQHGPEKKQIDHLSRLDLGPLGAYFAMRFEKMTCVLAEMGLKTEYAMLKLGDQRTEIFSYAIHDDKTFQMCMHLNREGVGLLKNNRLSLFDYEDAKRFYYRYMAKPNSSGTQLIDIAAYYKIASLIDNRSKNLTQFYEGPVFVVQRQNTVVNQASLPESYISGFVCVINETNESVALYFINRNNTFEQVKKLDFDAHRLNEFIKNLSNSPKTDQEAVKAMLQTTPNPLEKLLPHQVIGLKHAITTPLGNDEQYSELPDKTKASLLYLCAIACSGKRASKIATSPVSELPDFLKALQSLALKSEVGAEQLIEAIHEHGLHASTCPTLKEFTTLIQSIIQSIPLSPPREGIQDEQTDIISVLKGTLQVIDDYGDAAFEIFQNYRDCVVKKNQIDQKSIKDASTPTWDVPNYQTLIENLHDVHQALQPDSSKNPNTLIEISPILAMVRDTGSEEFVRLVMTWIGALEQLNPKLKSMLIQQLKDINLEASKSQVDFNTLSELCQAMRDAFEGRDIYIQQMPCFPANVYVWDATYKTLNYNEANGDTFELKTVKLKRDKKEQIKSFFNEIFSKLPENQTELHLNEVAWKQAESYFARDQISYPANYIDMDALTLKNEVLKVISTKSLICGRQKMEESMIDLLSVFRAIASEKSVSTIKDKTDNIIKNLPFEYLKTLSKEILDLLTELRDLVNVDANLSEDFSARVQRETKALSLLDGIDQSLLKLQSQLPSLLKESLKQIFIYAREDKKDEIDQFFINPSLSLFWGPPAEEGYCCQMKQKLNSLQLNDKQFEAFLLKKTKLDADNKTSSQVALAYSKRFNQLNQFLNSLITLRNTYPSDFQDCLNKLFHQTWYEKFDFDDFSRLFVVFNEIKAIPVIDQLTQVLMELEQHEDQGNRIKRLGQVLTGLQDLIQYQNNLQPEELKRCFNDSIKHNFQSDTPFIFGGQIKIQKICEELKNLEGTDKNRLRDALYRVYELIPKQPDESEANRFLDETIEKIKDKLPEILPFTLHLLSCIQSVRDYHQYNTMNLFDKIPNEKTKLKKWRQIFSAKETMADLSLQDLEVITTGLVNHGEHLTSMCEVLFEAEPFPAKQKWMDALSSQEQEALTRFQEQFDLHPYGEENGKKQQHNLGDEQVAGVIGGIQRLLGNQALSEADQLHLKLQFDYVNGLNNGQILRLIETDGNPISLIIDNQPRSEFNLQQCTRKTLNQLSRHLIDQFRKVERVNSSSERLCHAAPAHRRLTLQLLAVMRTQYYRSTGRIPNSTQMLTLIYALDQPDRQLFGINTGEGKSITTALFAALLAAKGGTVCVPTANRPLVRQDYHKKQNDRFFRSLGIKSCKIDDNSVQKDFQVGGIHYGTDADLSNFCSNAELKGWNLLKDNQDQIYPLYMVKDEYDYAMDDRTQFKRAIPYQADQAAESPYAWIYEEAIRFVRKDKFKESGEAAWDAKEDVRQLRDHLNLVATDHRTGSPEKQQHVIDWDSRLDKLIDDAVTVCRYKQDSDFFTTHLDEDGKPLGYSIAVPFQDKFLPKWGSTFPGNCHALLHARLNLDNPGMIYRFPIDSEQFCIASRSNMGFMRLFKSIIGLTGTPGSHDELLEQQDKFGMYATEIPPHKEGKRDELAPLLVRKADLDQAVIDSILYQAWYQYPLPRFVMGVLDSMLSLYQLALHSLGAALGYKLFTDKQPQPVLVVAQDIMKAKALYEKLVKKFGRERVQFISGEETNEDRESMLVKAGKDGWITVSTPLSGRGTDIDPSHPDGLLTIKVDFFSTMRDERQIMGRSARKGQNGRYLAIYDEAKLPISDWLTAVFGLSEAERKKRIAYQQEQLNQEVAVQRFYLQEVDDIQQVIFSQFDAWMSALLGEKGGNRDLIMTEGRTSCFLENKLLRQRGDLIQALSDSWQVHLRESKPELPNPFICRNEAGTLNTEHLDEALKAFESDALDIWKQFQGRLDEVYKLILDKKLSDKDKARCELLKKDKLETSLQYRKFTLHRDRTKKTMAAAGDKARVERRLKMASTAELAMLHYDEGQLNDAQRSELRQKHLSQYLDKVSTALPIGGDLGIKQKTSVERFKFLVNFLDPESNTTVDVLLDQMIRNPTLNKSTTFRRDDVLQTAAFDCVEFYELLREYLPLEAGQFSDQINRIRDKYIKPLSKKLATGLLSKLAWADNSKGFYCQHIEYTQVMDATREIRAAAEFLKINLNDNEQKNLALQKLHQVLVKHQQRLNRMWYYFPFGYYFFGYTDTREVIQQALAQIDLLSQADYSPEARYVAHESGKCQAYLVDFLKELDKLKLPGAVEPAEDWSNVIQPLEDIYKRPGDFPVVSVVDEWLHYLLTMQKNGSPSKFIMKSSQLGNINRLFQPSSSRDPIKRLIDRLTSIKQAIHRDHPHVDPLCGELFLSRKEDLMAKYLKKYLPQNSDVNSAGKKIELEIKPGHTGFKPYYEMIIKADHGLDLSEIGFDRDPRREEIEGQFKDIQNKITLLQGPINPEIVLDQPRSVNGKQTSTLSILGNTSSEVSDSAILANNVPSVVTKSNYFAFMPSLRNQKVASADSNKNHFFTGAVRRFANSVSTNIKNSMNRSSRNINGQVASPLTTHNIDSQPNIAELEAQKAILGERLLQCSANIMSRRFDSLGELLDFENTLRVGKRTNPPPKQSYPLN